MTRSCHILGAPVESGAKQAGCLMAPAAIRTAGLPESEVPTKLHRLDGWFMQRLPHCDFKYVSNAYVCSCEFARFHINACQPECDLCYPGVVINLKMVFHVAVGNRLTGDIAVYASCCLLTRCDSINDQARTGR